MSHIAYIEVGSEEPLEKAIKRFKRMVEKEGIIREWKKREFFEKPSAILNRKKKALERKRMKRQRKLKNPMKPSAVRSPRTRCTVPVRKRVVSVPSI